VKARSSLLEKNSTHSVMPPATSALKNSVKSGFNSGLAISEAE